MPDPTPGNGPEVTLQIIKATTDHQHLVVFRKEESQMVSQVHEAKAKKARLKFLSNESRHFAILPPPESAPLLMLASAQNLHLHTADGRGSIASYT